MKSLNLIPAFFLAAAAAPQFVPDPPVTPPSDTGIPQFSTMSGGITLDAASGTQFTSMTGTWDFPGLVSDGSLEPAFEFFTQYLALDLLPIPDNFEHGFQPPLPLPPNCDNFLQVGVNLTYHFAFVFDSNPTIVAYPFFQFSHVTHNITDLNENQIFFVPGETVTITINATTSGATFTYDSSINGPRTITVDGLLCLQYAQWMIGASPNDHPPTWDEQGFRNTSVVQTDLATGDEVVLGAPNGVQTTLATPGGDAIAIIIDVEETSFQLEADAPNNGY